MELIPLVMLAGIASFPVPPYYPHVALVVSRPIGSDGTAHA